MAINEKRQKKLAAQRLVGLKGKSWRRRLKFERNLHNPNMKRPKFKGGGA